MTLADILRELRVEAERDRPAVPVRTYEDREREWKVYQQGQYEGALHLLDQLEDSLRHEDIDPAEVRP